MTSFETYMRDFARHTTADQLILEAIQEIDAKFIVAFRAAHESAMQQHYTDLRRFTYHLLGLDDASDVDWEEQLMAFRDGS
jgi:hypothetical protein